MDKVTSVDNSDGILTFSALLDDSVWCTVYVTHYNRVEPDFDSWASPDDYYGYVEIDWAYDCPRQITAEESEELEQEAISLVEQVKQEYREESRINSWEIMKMLYE